MPILSFKANVLLILSTLCFQVSFSYHYHHKRHKDSETSTYLGPSLEDKDVLKEALQLMNVGKKTLGLNTDDPEILMQLSDNSSDKSGQIRNFLRSENFTIPSGEKFLIVSGKNVKMIVNNYTTEVSDLEGNTSDTEDVFKMVLEKKYPGKSGKGKVHHKITIVESNQLKPFDEKQFPRPSPVAVGRRKRHKARSFARFMNVQHARKKRMKDESTSSYVLEKEPQQVILNDAGSIEENKRTKDDFKLDFIAFLHNNQFLQPNVLNSVIPQMSNQEKNIINNDSSGVIVPKEKQFLDNSYLNKIDYDKHEVHEKQPFIENSGASKTRDLPQIQEKFLITRLFQVPIIEKEKEGSYGPFIELSVLFSVFSTFLVLSFLIYRVWKNRSISKTLESRKADVANKLKDHLDKGLTWSNKGAYFNAPFNNIDYQAVDVESSTEDLEWQSEKGEWLLEGELGSAKVYS